MGVISGHVIFMIAMVRGFNASGGPEFARGRIIRTSSGGFDVFGVEDPSDPHGVVTFASDGGGTLMIAATADASGTYDCRVQMKQKDPGFGTLRLQHMMSLVFRPGI